MRQVDIAAEYGISQPAVSKIKKQAEAQYQSKASDESHDISVDRAIKDLAVEKMMLAMGLITEERLESLKAADLARVSSSLAQVVGVVAPAKTQAPLVNLVVYAPEVKDESKFRIVEISKE
jgi:predicted transcriptional regulator